MNDPAAPDPAKPTAESDAGGERFIDRTIRTYAEEPMLWPVLVSGVLIFATFGAAVLLLALKDRRFGAQGALLLLALLSVRALLPDLRRRRLSPASWLLLGLWASSLLVAAGLLWLGVF